MDNFVTFDPELPPEEIPMLVDLPAYFWGGTFPMVGDWYAWEVYEVNDSRTSGNKSVKLRPVKL